MVLVRDLQSYLATCLLCIDKMGREIDQTDFRDNFNTLIFSIGEDG
jgi:hypothetical protein